MYDFSKLFKKPLNDQGPLGQKPKPDVVDAPLWGGIKPPPWADEATQQSWRDSINQPIKPGTTGGPDLGDVTRPRINIGGTTLASESGGRGQSTGRFMSEDMWEEKFPDRPYMTDEEGYEIDSRSDAGGPRRGLTPKKSTTLSANEKKRQAALEGASNSPMQNSASMAGSQRRGITAKKTLLTRARAGAN